MSFSVTDNGWNRVTPVLDVEVLHGVPVRVSKTEFSTQADSTQADMQQIDESLITEKVHELTGLHVSVCDPKNVSASEQEWSVCVDKKEFEEVLRRLALASAAMFVDRFHKAIDRNDVDWDSAEYNYDFNHAMEHCCIPWGTLNKNDYFERYVDDMHKESLHLINAGISPHVGAE